MDNGFDIGPGRGKAKERRMIFPVCVSVEPDGVAMIQDPSRTPNGVLVLFGAPRGPAETRDALLDRTMLCVDPLTVD